MLTPELPTLFPVLLPRDGLTPLLPGYDSSTCGHLDGWQATVPVLGWLFATAPVADRGLLRELNRGRRELRELSLIATA